MTLSGKQILNAESHVVDILGSTRGRDQPIMIIEKALQLITRFDEEILMDPDTAFFDPFCKAGEIVLTAAMKCCFAKNSLNKAITSHEEIVKEIYLSDRFFALCPDKRHHLLSIRTFCGNEKSHNPEYRKNIRNGDYLSEVDGRLDEEKFKKELKSMLEYISTGKNKRRIIVAGNPPYQESDGGGTGKSAVPVYNIFVEALINSPEIEQFVVVIPSRWFAGGKGLDSFRKRILESKKVRSITNFSNSSQIFPSVDINGGVCFLHYDKTADFDELTFQENGETFSLSLEGLDILPDDPRSVDIVKKLLRSWPGPWVSDRAQARNAFKISPNAFDRGITREADGRLKCYFERRQIKYLEPHEVNSNQNLIQHYKVVVSKAAGGSKGKRRSTIPTSVIFTLKPGEICSETYSVIATYKDQKSAEKFASYLKTNFVRYFVGLRKITQNISRDTWAWIPYLEPDQEWTDEKLFQRFKITKSERDHIVKKVEEWS